MNRRRGNGHQYWPTQLTDVTLVARKAIIMEDRYTDAMHSIYNVIRIDINNNNKNNNSIIIIMIILLMITNYFILLTHFESLAMATKIYELLLGYIIFVKYSFNCFNN